MKPGLQLLPGKTIAAVITATCKDSPRQQLILVFTDGTQLELHGEHFDCTKGLDRGDVAEAVRFARGTGGDVDVFVQELVPEGLAAAIVYKLH